MQGLARSVLGQQTSKPCCCLPAGNGDLAEKQSAQEAAALMRLAQGASLKLNEANGGSQSSTSQASDTDVITTYERMLPAFIILVLPCRVGPSAGSSSLAIDVRSCRLAIPQFLCASSSCKGLAKTEGLSACFGKLLKLKLCRAKNWLSLCSWQHHAMS